MIKILDIDNIQRCSINQKYNRNFSLTGKYRNFKKHIKLCAKKKFVESPLSVLIVAEMYIDIDAAIKPIFDSLEGINFYNDRDVLELRVLKKYHKKSKESRLMVFAKNIDMQISLDEEILHIMIKDNGKGFDVRMQKKGIGIKNIKSRIARLCGEFLLTSNLDLGTKIDIKIPIKKHCNVKKNFSTLS